MNTFNTHIADTSTLELGIYDINIVRSLSVLMASPLHQI